MRWCHIIASTWKTPFPHFSLTFYSSSDSWSRALWELESSVPLFRSPNSRLDIGLLAHRLTSLQGTWKESESVAVNKIKCQVSFFAFSCLASWKQNCHIWRNQQLSATPNLFSVVSLPLCRRCREINQEMWPFKDPRVKHLQNALSDCCAMHSSEKSGTNKIK